MSHRKVFDAVEQLGGNATAKEVIDYIKQQDPTDKNPEWVWDRLKKMHKSGHLNYNYKSRKYFIPVEGRPS